MTYLAGWVHIALQLCSACILSQADTTCMPGWHSFNESCFAVFNNPREPSSVEDAVALCARDGGALASLHSIEEHQAVFDMMHEETTAWIGVSTRSTNGAHYWVDGSAWDFNKWAIGEPNGADLVWPQMCGIIHKMRMKQPLKFNGWLDWTCNGAGRGFVNATVCRMAPQVASNSNDSISSTSLVADRQTQLQLGVQSVSTSTTGVALRGSITTRKKSQDFESTSDQISRVLETGVSRDLIIALAGLTIAMLVTILAVWRYRSYWKRHSGQLDTERTKQQEKAVEQPAQISVVSDQGVPSDRPVSSELPEGKKYHFFVSHKKAHSTYGNLSEQVSIAMKDALNALGLVGFIDIDDLKRITQQELRRAVVESCVMLIFVNDETCRSEWCRMEWETAMLNNIPVLCIMDLRFDKQLTLARVTDTNPYLLVHQWIEYTERTRRSVAQEIVEWINRSLASAAGSQGDNTIALSHNVAQQIFARIDSVKVELQLSSTDSLKSSLSLCPTESVSLKVKQRLSL